MTQQSAEPHAWGGGATFSPLQLLDALEYAVTAIDLDGRLVVWNRAAEQLFGYPAGQMLGHTMLDVAPAIGPGFAGIQERLRAGEAWSGEALIQRRDKSTFAVPATHTPIYDAGGELVGIASLWAGEHDGAPTPYEPRLDWAVAAPAHAIVEATLRGLVEFAPDGILTIDGTGRIALTNRRAEQMFGYAHGELLGQSVDVLVPERQRATLLARRADYLTAPRPRPVRMELNLYGRRKDGGEFPVEISLSPLDTAGGLLTTAIVRDATVRRAIEVRAGQAAAEQAAQAEAEDASARLAFLSEASAALVAALDERAILQRLADMAVPTLADFCFFDALTPAGQIRRVAWKHADPEQQVLFDQVGQFTPPQDFVGHPVSKVLSTRESELVPSVDDLWMQRAATTPEHLAFMRSLVFHSLMTVPLIAADKVFGALTFCYTPLSGRRPGPADLALAQELARRAALAVDHARLHAETMAAHAQSEAAEQRARFLAEASALLAMSLDYGTTLQSIAQLVVPRLADVCVVFIVDTDNTIRRVAAAHADPAQEAILRILQEHAPLDPHGPHPAAQVIRSGQSVFNPVITEATLELVSQGIDDQRTLRALIPTSHIIVPMIARQQVLGAISFGMSDSRRTYSLADLAMAEELAHRAALATDSARLYQLAQDALQVRDTFLSIAAHELKTPLAALLGNTQLLQRRIQSGATINDRHLRSVQVIADQTSRLHKLILMLLDLSRIQTRQLVIERAPVDLSALVRRVVNEMQPTLDQHTMTYILPDEPLIVHGDALRLEQVVQNLIANAIKYSPDGGSVMVEVGQQRAVACVAVTDQGIGIPESELPQLFELFYRASNTADRFVSGMGIGLAVIKEIVTLHGGTVSVHSVEGSGSTFTVCLPLRAAQEAYSARRPRPRRREH